MREIKWIAVLLLSSAAIVALLTGTGLISLPLGTQETVNGQSASSGATRAKDTGDKPHQQSLPDYNPYPPGIIPADLESEIARVLREVDFIENRALARWRALPPPIQTGQPPTLQNTGTESMETLGELMNFDRNMSPGKNQACSSCHMPYVAFSGPIPSVNATMIAYPGTVHFRAGKRTAQRYTYSPFFPVLQYNQDQALFFGGNFWDSRSTGFRLRNPHADKHSIPLSIPRKWVTLTLLASLTSSRSRLTNLSLNWCGAKPR